MCHICAILLLQGTWLYDFDLSLCNSVHKDFYGQGLSSVNSSSGLLAGRPHGGLAILWRKSLGVSCKINTCDHERLVNIEFSDGRKMKYLFLNVYMPFESYKNYHSFLHYQGNIALSW